MLVGMIAPTNPMSRTATSSSGTGSRSRRTFVRMRAFLCFSALSLCLTYAPVQAQHLNEPSAPCQEAGSQIDLEICLEKAYSLADAELNDTYRRIMSVLDDAEKASLRGAQRAWIVYRDKACDAEAAPYRDGTGKGTALLACLEAITRQRTQFMKVGLWWQVEKFGG